MSSEETEGASPQWGHTRTGTLGTWRAQRQHGGRAQNRPYTTAKRWVEAVGNRRNRSAKHPRRESHHTAENARIRAIIRKLAPRRELNLTAPAPKSGNE
jgi:hypothetical protein